MTTQSPLPLPLLSLSLSTSPLLSLLRCVNELTAKCQCSTGAGPILTAPPAHASFALDSYRLKATDTHSNLLGLSGGGGERDGAVCEGGESANKINQFVWQSTTTNRAASKCTATLKSIYPSVEKSCQEKAKR